MSNSKRHLGIFAINRSTVVCSEVSEQVAHLLVAQFIEQTFGHDRRGAGRAWRRCRRGQGPTSLPSPPRKTTTFLSSSTTMPESTRPSVIATIDVVYPSRISALGLTIFEKHVFQIVAPVGGEIGPNLAPLAKERMAARTLLVEDLPARLGHAGTGVNRACEPVDAHVVRPKSLA